MKVLNDELTVKTTTAQLNEDTAVDSSSDRKGTVAFHTFNGEDIEITNDYLVPFNAIDNVKVVHAKSESEVEDDTCQGGEPPVPPTPKPTINGANDITIAEGTSFDPMAGVSATDYEGNPLEVTVSGTVDVNVPAVYTLTYTATDSHGGTTTVRRKVTVIETDAPIINGANDVTINQGVGIDLADGVTATLDGEPISFTYDPTELDKCEIGSHTVVYSATGNGKTTTVNRVVTITEIANPTISGLDTLTVEVNEEFDPLLGVTGTDGNGNDVEVTYEEPEPPEQYVIMVDVSNYTAPNSTPTQSAYWQYEALEYEVEGVLADGVPATVTRLTTADDAVIHLHFGDEFVVSLHDRYNATFTSTVSGLNPPNEVTFERLIIKYLEH